MPQRADQQPPIEDYFLIGDLHSAALVSRGGSVDWLCLPDFDSPSIFASLLDTENGGTFRLNTDTYEYSTHYVPKTAIVETDVTNRSGSFAMRTFMLPQPVDDCTNHLLMIKLVGTGGTHRITFTFDPRPDYAQHTPTLTHNEDFNTLSFSHDGQSYLLHMPEGASVKMNGAGADISIPLTTGEEKRFIFECIEKDALSCVSGQDFESATYTFWKRWVEDGEYIEWCKDRLVRSAITLKLMQYYPTGAIIAAPTTSLPESIGGERNWDYRYVWIRDATYTLYSLTVLGRYTEAHRFFDYIEDIVDQDDVDDVHLMYTIHGEVVEGEKSLPHLSGYRGSKPVRVGNDAADQFQLDVYGALIDAMYFSHTHGMEISKRKRRVLLKLVDRIADRWMEKDNGIWEIRRDREHYTYSKVMAQVGVNRVLRMKDVLSLSDERIAKLEKLEHDILAWLKRNVYDQKRERILQHPNTDAQDATNFLFVLLKYLDKSDPKTADIIENTYHDLRGDSVFVYRYKNPDGFESAEGAFVLCAFWYMSVLAVLGRVDEARRLFERFERFMPESGLIAEEIDPNTGRYLGNFPQAFSHMGYIMSAYYIDKYRKRDETND